MYIIVWQIITNSTCYAVTSQFSLIFRVFFNDFFLIYLFNFDAAYSWPGLFTILITISSHFNITVSNFNFICDFDEVLFYMLVFEERLSVYLDIINENISLIENHKNNLISSIG